MKIKGFPVVDARTPLVIHISPRDIKNSSAKNPSSCAAAKACMRQIKGCAEVRVHLSRTFVRIGNKWLRYATSPATRSEIIALDRGGTFEPGDYMLQRPQVSTGRQQGSKTSQTRSKRYHKRRTPAHIITGVRPGGRHSHG